MIGGGRFVRAGVGLALLMAVGRPSVAAAQSAYTVTGRVAEPDGDPIAGAVIELEGHRPLITTQQGSFLFEEVEEGTYTIRVTAFGYETLTDVVVVEGDTTLDFRLAVAPFQLDTLRADARRIRLRGEIRDADRDRSVVGAEIYTDLGGEADSNAAGRFEVDAWAGAPVRVLVRAFGYLPLDSVVVVEEGEDTYRFLLREDPVVRRMLRAAEEQMEARARGRIAITMGPLDREDLLRWRGASLDDVLRTEFPTRARRIRCVVLDERPLTPLAGEGVLTTTQARDVHRMEFLFGGAMLRIYTRDYMRTMLGRDLALKQPVYVDAANPPVCW
ncbi:MAG: carboxypeptidase-like regulatory domain-containing protein [Longimicrobiales bacterium]|nr:carboxypeptidase-like regulatory domain-containing protein [Longimicrobiales bacterium]